MENRINFDNLEFSHFVVSQDNQTILGTARETLSTRLQTFIINPSSAKVKDRDSWIILSDEDTRRLREIIKSCLYFNSAHIYKTEEAIV